MKFLTSFSRQFTTLVIGSIFMLTLLIGVQALQAQTKLSSVTSSTELLEPADQNRIQASPSALTKYTASTGNVYQDNLPIKLKGINWFGFETNDHVVHGLWARNWQSMIIQMKSLGFNAVRLPICPATLQGSSVSTINYSLNPDLNGLNSLQILDKILNELNAQGMYILLDHHNYLQQMYLKCCMIKVVKFFHYHF
jgi:aryl-phospho-beta-D-glucosidase BglC (GH1 family)